MAAPAFVYIAPARYEDILKIGFSHDPCDRVRCFHPRWFEYFDLERGFVLAATDEKDARRIERTFAEHLREHRARAPLVIEEAAGGYTEWYRGAHDRVHELAARVIEDGGYAAAESLAERMRQRLLLEREQAFERTTVLIDAIDALQTDATALALRRSLRSMLDAYAWFGIDLRESLSVDSVEWLARELPGV